MSFLAARREVRTVADGYQRLMGAPADRDERRRIAAALKGGATVGEELLRIGRSDAYRMRIITSLENLSALGDEEFIRQGYLELFHREPDPGGATYYRQLLDEGMSRAKLIDIWAGSDEHVNRVVAEVYPLENLRLRHPERFADVPDLSGSTVVPCFRAEDDAAIAWMNSKIDEHAYYDHPGVWGFSVNPDKLVMADLLSSFEPRLALDLGCSNGTIMKCLYDLGVKAEGIELSSAAVRQAFPEIRDRIHLGSVTEMPGSDSYDLIYGLDIFEHVTPKDLGQIISAVYDRLEPGGYLFANIPAYGDDEIFGDIFEINLASWRDSADRGEPFTLLPTDEYGFPHHGHLIFAAASWWQQQFEAAGFVREPVVERALHGRYANYFRAASPSRLAFFVFAKNPDPAAIQGAADRIAANLAPLPA